MAKEAPWKNRIRSVILLALFYFLFLGSEYLFDNSIIYHTDSHGVVIAQSYILGISTLGFLFYPVFKYLTVKKAAGLKYLGIFFCFLVGTVCYFLINRHPGYALTLTAGCVLFFSAGNSWQFHTLPVFSFIDSGFSSARCRRIRLCLWYPASIYQ